ncbi:hypothetical protein LARV_01472 [Longilinea arvoryzae]|uniref:Uncharacterized protein n=1 Tax=Longilinea arvoryzae TaxID=360412 RepID=A0A0S7BIV0_9CHLR|nr:hypothetical protein [Longilinea arvoryzae]GAP13717.1 hypothetical protein LARV_01472 [Longilinea arvoryzae]
MGMSFLFGVIGGVLGELLKWYAMRESPNLPTYLRSPFYWVVTVLMVLAGGGLVLIQGVKADNPWLAINVGITAPLILKGFAAVVPVQPAKAGGVSFGPSAKPKPTLINFMAGR